MEKTNIAKKNEWAVSNEFHITIDADIHPKQKNHVALRGKFTLPAGEHGVPKEGVQIFKHIVLVTTRSGNYQSLAPYKDAIVFEDDIQNDGNIYSGFFNMNVMDHIQFDGVGDYYLLCSVGTYTSNIIKVSIV